PGALPRIVTSRRGVRADLWGLLRRDYAAVSVRGDPQPRYREAERRAQASAPVALPARHPRGRKIRGRTRRLAARAPARVVRDGPLDCVRRPRGWRGNA